MSLGDDEHVLFDAAVGQVGHFHRSGVEHFKRETEVKRGHVAGHVDEIGGFVGGVERCTPNNAVAEVHAFGQAGRNRPNRTLNGIKGSHRVLRQQCFVHVQHKARNGVTSKVHGQVDRKRERRGGRAAGRVGPHREHRGGQVLGWCTRNDPVGEGQPLRQRRFNGP